MNSIAVIPACNEEKRIKNILTRIKDYVDCVVVVDDGSSDNTYHEASSVDKKIIVLRHRMNLGKGAALKTGCEAAVQLGSKTIILLDADGQHNPEDIPRFIQKMDAEKLDVVFGSRKIGKDMPFMMFAGNKFLSLTISFLFGIYVSDSQSGYRTFTSSVYPKIKWKSNKYAVETEMIINIAKHKLSFREIEIQTIYLDKHKGTTVFDGIRIFINMLIWKIL